MRCTKNSMIMLVLLLLTACGQTGPLFLPGDPSQIQTEPVFEETADEADTDDDDQASEPR